MRKEKRVPGITTMDTAARICLLGFIALTSSGCATTPPAQEMSDARQSLETAQIIGADEHAPEVMGNAQQLLIQAENEIQSGDYEQAQKDAAAALEAARQAVAITQAQQEPKENALPPEPAPMAQIPREPAIPSHYTVASKDNLWSIAAKPSIYGDSRLWPLLLKANAGVIKSPDVIKPGITLQIERNLTAEEIDSALEYSRKRGAGPLKASDIGYLRQYGLR